MPAIDQKIQQDHGLIEKLSSFKKNHVLVQRRLHRVWYQVNLVEHNAISVLKAPCHLYIYPNAIG
jgi:hypothetical protein